MKKKKFLKKKNREIQLADKGTTRLNFLETKKTTLDKWHDVVSKYKHSAFVFNKKTGETNFSVRMFNKIIKKELKISSDKKVKNFFAEIYSKADIKKINKYHTGYQKKKKQTKLFTKHTFTFKNFFKRKIRKTKKHEQYYYRAGLEMVFRSKNSGNFIFYNGEKIQIWTIPNIPISHYSFNGYPKGYKEFFEKIKSTVDGYDSLLYFLFNYFDVSILDMTK